MRKYQSLKIVQKYVGLVNTSYNSFGLTQSAFEYIWLCVCIKSCWIHRFGFYSFWTLSKYFTLSRFTQIF